ncbi:hypothetical protein GCM10008995_15980 [Halobellus salinus]|uniref:Uncharacterized protein n=1 Tax=Halobellus salinus TaxID=931585 RepID=A0A830EI18_9EURY|nr:hypothetical protein [Halobellus salinus]GGJ06877.1 hypothetical protein GCM10008995_15980 [Halobellus salinus]SMP15295.1 hypothetical protein SAMN06265347_105106 [Halobellus salinus]
MRPADAAQQLRYAVGSRTGSSEYELDYWEANAYQDVFADVADRGDLSDVMNVIEAIGDRSADGRRPTAVEARRIADRILTPGGRPLADGGDGD